MRKYIDRWGEIWQWNRNEPLIVKRYKDGNIGGFYNGNGLLDFSLRNNFIERKKVFKNHRVFITN